MLAVILGEGASSRLYNNLIENQPEHIFNMIDAENYSFRDGSNFFVQANFNPEYKEKAIELVKEELNDTPILLLDDVLSELDKHRQNYLLDSIDNIQTIITCTGLDEFVNHRFSINKIFHIKNGHAVNAN